jgi:hypothetical protein
MLAPFENRTNNFKDRKKRDPSGNIPEIKFRAARDERHSSCRYAQAGQCAACAFLHLAMIAVA